MHYYELPLKQMIPFYTSRMLSGLVFHFGFVGGEGAVIFFPFVTIKLLNCGEIFNLKVEGIKGTKFR